MKVSGSAWFLMVSKLIRRVPSAFVWCLLMSIPNARVMLAVGARKVPE